MEEYPNTSKSQGCKQKSYNSSRGEDLFIIIYLFLIYNNGEQA